MGLILTAICTGVPELGPQRKQTNADHNLDSKNANEEQQIALVPPSWSTVLIHHVFCSGLCGNVDNLRRMWK
jgi:hypothetical protein